MSIDYEARQAMLHEPCTHPHVALEHGTVTAPGMVQTSMDEAPVATAGQTDTAETGRVLWVGTERIFLPGSSLGLVALLSRLAALEADTDWLPLTLAAGFTGGSGSFLPAYRIRAGHLSLKGWVRRDAGNFGVSLTTVATLPAPGRPDEVCGLFPLMATNANDAASVPWGQVETDGQIRVAALASPGTDLVYLRGIHYPLPKES